MKHTITTRQKASQFIRILIPILITQITLSLMTFFDTMMSGHASPADLAGAAIGISLWIPVQTGLSGVLMGITPIISQLIGRGAKDKIAFNVMQGIMLSLLISLVVIVVGGLSLNALLNLMHLEPKVHYIAHQFLIAIGTGVIPLFGYMVIKSFIDATGNTRISMFITLTSLPINVALNYLLIFGKLGFPKLGGIGSGVGSAITYWCIFILSLVAVHKFKAFKEYAIFRKFYKISIIKWKELLKIGVPIGFAIFFETAVFAGVTLLMSRFDTVTIAAHQAAMNFATTLYMIPLSICLSLTILVGFETGASRLRDAKQYAKMGVLSAVALSILTAIFLLLFTKNVAALYSTAPEVVAMTEQFLIYAIFFQLSDAIATPIQGALRGYKDVNSPFFLAFIAYWIIGLPLGYVLANYTNQGPFGYWVGLISGLGVAAVLLIWRLSYIQRKLSQEVLPV
ncbi:MATE family multidrug resistance protein [Paenibacillus shirakamiensis]|uniref:Probable multidrug resistance protein NorM n=1 Tax=Paenibacillus shirakamiensis TaxID=1265935 RepID=A0ABS4JJY7_9BACL|nr:MATE family efflux transporter [Paenibacillus shirakamiensis]MBP2001296.1 MATE family multidrug resistance protein [Paenibacillus shirakamiensis]